MTLPRSFTKTLKPRACRSGTRSRLALMISASPVWIIAMRVFFLWHHRIGKPFVFGHAFGPMLVDRLELDVKARQALHPFIGATTDRLSGETIGAHWIKVFLW